MGCCCFHDTWSTDSAAEPFLPLVFIPNQPGKLRGSVLTNIFNDFIAWRSAILQAMHTIT